MRVIGVRNVHEALPLAMELLLKHGLERPSRNGPVLVYPEPVTTVYHAPQERVLFWPERDANPFLHLYESLWMLLGRSDVAPLLRYSRQFAEYSDDGRTLHGAYGYRWRRMLGRDQLRIIARRLAKNPDDRRCVLQMWDTEMDLDRDGRDVPCNLAATFQVGVDGALDMTVLCRSNDVVWGAYGANAVHLSLVQEYLALLIGVPVGDYTQVSVNWHAYVAILDERPGLARLPTTTPNPYASGDVLTQPLTDPVQVDELVRLIVSDADEGFPSPYEPPEPSWSAAMWIALRAHHVYKTTPGEARFDAALEVLDSSRALVPARIDWIVAARQWVERRRDAQALRAAREGETLGEA